MKKLFVWRTLILLSLLALPNITFAYLAPHNEISNNIACEDCHLLDRWGGGNPPDPYFLKKCENCHNNDTGSGYSRDSAPAVETHSAASFGSSGRYGDWARDCWDCHGHKFAETFLAAGTYNPTGGFSVAGGNTTFTVNLTFIDPKWDANDPSNWNGKDWSEKTDLERGLMFAATYPEEFGTCSVSTDISCQQDTECPQQNTCSVSTGTSCTLDTDCPAGETCNLLPSETCVNELSTVSFEIINKTGNDVTVKGDLNAFLADPGNAFVTLDGDFEIFYGQMIRQTVEGTDVVFSDNSTFAVNDGCITLNPGNCSLSTTTSCTDDTECPQGEQCITLDCSANDPSPDGICQVCHTQTKFWKNDGTLANHLNGFDCSFCHSHKKGFMPSCNTCHAFPPVDPSGLVTEPAPTGSQTAGLHDFHIDKLSGRSEGEYLCDFCHITGMPVTPTIGDPNGLQVDFSMPYNDGDVANDPDIYNGTNALYTGQTGVMYDQTALTTVMPIGSLGDGSLTCSNTYCHSNGQSILFAGYQPRGTSPAWDDSSIDPDGEICNNCHMDVPNNDEHRKHVVVRGYSCNTCHYASVDHATYPVMPNITDKTLHVNGQFDVSPSPTWALGNNEFTYTPAPGGGRCFFSDDPAISCHRYNSKPLNARWVTFPITGTCGNGVLEGLEECDDGDQNNFNNCSNTCTVQYIEFEICSDYIDNNGDGRRDETPCITAGTDPTADCTDADNDSFVDIADQGNGCYITGTPATAPPYDECDLDPSISTATIYYQDLDGDNYGNANATQGFCPGDDTTGYVLDNTDCDDRPDGEDGTPGNADDGANINPGAIDNTVDGIDQDCDGFDNGALNILYFPTVLDSEGLPFFGSFSVQNLDTIEASYKVECYNLDGSPAAIFDPADPLHSPPNLPPIADSNIRTIPANGTDKFRVAGAGTAWETRGESFGYVDFTGSCTVKSDHPILVMLSFQNITGSGSFTVFESAKRMPVMNFPKVFDRSEWFWETWLTIFNPFSSQQCVTIEVFDGATNTKAGEESTCLAPKETYRKRASQILFPDFNGGQNWIQGSMLVTANNDPLPAQVTYQHLNGNNVDKVSVYGSVEATNVLYFPYNFETAGLPADGAIGPFESITLISPTAQQATVELYAYDGTPASTSPVTVTFNLPNEQITIRPAEYAGTPLTQPWEGVVKVSGNQPIIGIGSVQYVGTNHPDAQSFAFLFPAEPAKELYFPKAFDYSTWNWTNTVSIMNTTALNQTVQVDFMRLDGVSVTQSFVVPGNGAILVKPSDHNGGYLGDPAYFVGSITVRTNTPTDPPVSAVLLYGYYPDSNFTNYFGRLEVYNGLTNPLP